MVLNFFYGGDVVVVIMVVVLVVFFFHFVCGYVGGGWGAFVLVRILFEGYRHFAARRKK